MLPRGGEGAKLNADGLSKSEVEQLKSVFNLFDPGKNGRVPATALRRSLLNLSEQTDQSNVYRLLVELENKGDRALSFDEFVALFSKGSAALLKGGDISKKDANVLFAMIDYDNHGKIGFRELKRLVDELHEPISATEVEEMIHRADLDGDGLVDQDEFYRIISHRHGGTSSK
eukprot:Gregarina_sp_Pseudo_9__572@NODE_1369_length_1659_cov_319_741358_g1278_i0_p2_GENE_NODE_1369_length_1659_cov_319_741358_g1278_i0NODE_1369_length_1659_cov_319_741358_g1278_i0_p2_ORF_typecomplete_len173_score48_32EFhand_7/PF13499_6/1_4e05EFhand_7/PF13499_6/2_1e13EFhand_8/PF13833_6/1_3EFhand_8/PF13833_6/0_63EFhand_8/PF13833_6/0_00022EFhand_8/PF13833_6/4_7e09EFhand_11/PF08976_11/6_3e06EFhand_11/PF08976_11/1e05EFhand_1/PF00036_32/39EFhand_1/PF00036_32/2_6EFhand_1/PF00036_32/0_058EFhand_1/PF00036_32/2_1